MNNNGVKMSLGKLIIDKSIIQTGETATLTITATDLEHLPMPNKTIGIYSNDTLLDTVTTDTNGEATYTLTGTGSGLNTITAKYGSLQSETYELLDSIFYDKGLDGIGNHNDNWTKSSGMSQTRTDNYTLLSETATGTASYIYANNNTGISGDFSIEWDNHLTSDSRDYFILKGSSDVAKAFTSYDITGEGHVKLVIVDTTATVYVDNVNKGSYTVNRDSNGKMTFRYQINDNGADIGYSNFVIYPV